MDIGKLFTYLVPIGLHIDVVSSQPLGRSDSMVGTCLEVENRSIEFSIIHMKPWSRRAALREARHFGRGPKLWRSAAGPLPQERGD